MKNNEISRKEFLSIFSKVPRLCVDLVIENEEGILFTKRKIHPYFGKWHLPGGGVLLDETLHQAIKRVGREELNLNVEPVKIIGAIEYFKERKEEVHSVTIVFLTKINSGNIILNEQADDFIFSKTIPENTVYQQRDFLRNNFELFTQFC